MAAAEPPTISPGGLSPGTSTGYEPLGEPEKPASGVNGFAAGQKNGSNSEAVTFLAPRFEYDEKGLVRAKTSERLKKLHGTPMNQIPETSTPTKPETSHPNPKTRLPRLLPTHAFPSGGSGGFVTLHLAATGDFGNRSICTIMVQIVPISRIR